MPFDPKQRALDDALGGAPKEPFVSAFTAEEWADYDNGRPDRCQPDLIRRRALRMVQERDGF